MANLENIKNILSAAKHGKAVFIASSLFALLYHIAFLIVFFYLGVYPMAFFNIFSVTLFAILTNVSLRLEKFEIPFAFLYFEVTLHQLLAYYYMGGNASFQYLIYTISVLPILSFYDKFRRAITIGVLTNALFVVLEVMVPLSIPKYPLDSTIITVIKAVNIALVTYMILFSLILYAYIIWLMQTRLEHQIDQKKKEIEFNTEKLDALQNHIIRSLASLVESRDTDTGGHIQRTSEYVELLANKAFQTNYYPDIINEHYINLLKRAAPMHDIGKIVVPDSILKKEGRFTPAEFEQMKLHTTEGRRIIQEVIGIADDRDFIDIAADVATYHHERWDGTGYPYNLAGEDIPISARIMAIADVFDALVSQRCYKDALTPDSAFNIIEKEAGTHFDPTLVKLFLSVKEEIRIILSVYAQ